VWQQWWVVASDTADDAVAKVMDARVRWTPREAEPPAIGDVRFYRGEDDEALADQYVAEVAEIRDLVARTPRELLARRFAHVRQRGLGIPPRPGWVVLGEDGPRSPRPVDWSGRWGPRWVVEVRWSGEAPIP
jgi:hypothetical protein